VFSLTHLQSHTINQQSPLFGLTADQLAQEYFELVIVFDGVDEATAGTLQARYSYLPSEIMWNAEFEPCMYKDPDSGNYIVDHMQFDEIKMLRE
jgi:hypothetical protein